MNECDKISHSLLNITLSEILDYLEDLPFQVESKTINQIIMIQVVKKFIHFKHLIRSIKILEIADWEYEVTVNYRVKGTLLIKRKEGSDAS